MKIDTPVFQNIYLQLLIIFRIITMNIMKNLSCIAAFIAMSQLCAAQTDVTLAHWSFNNTYSVSGDVATPTKTAATNSTNLHGLKLRPNTQAGSSDTWLMPWRPTRSGQVAAQDDKGAYLEQGAISCDGCALHLTSPVPTPKDASTSYSWGDKTEAFPDGSSYSYQKPYSYFEIQTSTLGYKNIRLSLNAAGHNSPTQYYAVAYSTDGDNWTLAGDSYLAGASYKTWVVTDVDLPLANAEKACIRVFPAATWKGPGSSVSQDNQFNLDDVYIHATLDAPLACIGGFSVGDMTASPGESYDYECKLPADFQASTVTIRPTVENASVSVFGEDADGDELDITDNGDGSYTIRTPRPNKSSFLTFDIKATDGAVALKSRYTLRILRIGEAEVATLTLDGTAIPAATLRQLNTGDSFAATFSGNIYTALPEVKATMADGSVPAITSRNEGTSAVYTIDADERKFTLTVDGVHIYTPGEKDEKVVINYTTAGKTDTGWSNGLYTLTCANLDGWNGTKFKFNSTDHTFAVPAGVIVKQFILSGYSANYGNGEGLTSLTSEGATTYIPSRHNFVRGQLYDLVCVVENHKPGAPLEFVLTGGNQPYAAIELLIEKTNPGTVPQLVGKEVKVNNNHAVVTLTFDREMKDTEATVNGNRISAEGGSTVLNFGVWNLDYNSTSTLTVAPGAASDFFGNTNPEAINCDIVTADRPVATKKAYDYVVSNVDEFKAAFAAVNASNKAADAERKVIFILNGDYNFEGIEQRLQCNNVSLIGESRDGVVIRGTRNGISNPVLNLRDRSGFYLQDLTLRNDFNYGMADKNSGQAVAVYGGNKTIMKNVLMLGNQDTQVTGERAYFDACEIHGTVDFICGGGDNFYDRCDLVLEDRNGNVIAAPNTAASLRWGYVFSNCTISAVDGAKEVTDGSYHLGRPWQNEPRIHYINTRMNVLPAPAGWTSMGTLPTHFYEFGSTGKDGKLLDLSERKNSPTSTNTYTPVLTEEEAARFTVINVLGGTDGWLPTDYTSLPEPPAATVADGSITWEADPQVRTTVIFKDGKYLANTTDTRFTPEADGIYILRSANDMGGLSVKATEINFSSSAITGISADSSVAKVEYLNLQGIRVNDNYRGIAIRVVTFTDGRCEATKVMLR